MLPEHFSPAGSDVVDPLGEYKSIPGSTITSRVIPKKAQAMWKDAAKKLCAAQAVVGPLWMILGGSQLSGDSRMNSMIVGALMLIIGVVGFIGLRQRRPHLLMFHLIAAGLGMVLILQELSKIELQVRLHCTSAYAFLRMDNLEKHVSAMQHEEMFSTLYTRMNEIDDMLDMFQAGDTLSPSATGSSQRLASESHTDTRDRFYIQAKLARLRGHAEKVQEMLIDKRRTLTDTVQRSGSTEGIQAEMQRVSEGIHFSSRVIERLTAREGKGLQPLMFDEYKQILNFLHTQMFDHSDGASKEVDQMAKNIQQESAQLPLIKATWNRLMTPAASVAPEDGPKAARQQKAVELRQQQRLKFEAEVREAFGMDQLLSEEASAGEHVPTSRRKPTLQQRMAGALESMPQACMMETRAWYTFELLGWALILFQGGVAYCILANLMQTPLKVM
eukprot:CAMPEP_0117659642 /NCGR_PEP_ID=MMETSP0804-20121206/6540_1 /TAXON_ID=1074897 /ORGANISM="Tetraselmis astigmatica, Strain CCMP880" /LENGTH=444 /DNA_ID=CAMNT_0005466311 /DNA_START=57 /DNA_END=1391 /DNA_ORIENTATION=-